MKKIKLQKPPAYVQHEHINLDDFGHYRIGLASEEITEYLKRRTGLKGPKLRSLRKKFSTVAGCNTMGVGPEGQGLMYRWDVQRFADKLLLKKETYFD